jgi:hypothetical protein
MAKKGILEKEKRTQKQTAQEPQKQETTVTCEIVGRCEQNHCDPLQDQDQKDKCKEDCNDCENNIAKNCPTKDMINKDSNPPPACQKFWSGAIDKKTKNDVNS